MDTALVCSKGIVGGNGIKCTTLDRDGNSNVIFKRDEINYMTFETDRVEINQELHLSDALIIDLENKLTMRPSLESGLIFLILEIYTQLLIIQ